MLRQISLLMLTVCLVISPIVASAADELWVQALLFNGKDLDGWQVTGCEPWSKTGGWCSNGPAMAGCAPTSGTATLCSSSTGARRTAKLTTRASTFARRCRPKASRCPSAIRSICKQGGEGNLLGLTGSDDQGAHQAGRVEPLQDHGDRRHGRAGDQRPAGLEGRRA